MAAAAITAAAVAERELHTSQLFVLWNEVLESSGRTGNASGQPCSCGNTKRHTCTHQPGMDTGTT